MRCPTCSGTGVVPDDDLARAVREDAPVTVGDAVREPSEPEETRPVAEIYRGRS